MNIQILHLLEGAPGRQIHDPRCDFELCTQTDWFGFVLQVSRHANGLNYT